MPNGGLLPSCWVCRWAYRGETDRQTIPSHLHRAAQGETDLCPIQCRLHQLVVYDSMSAFCADLSENQSPGLAEFIKKQQFTPQMMYRWLGMYDPEPVAVTTLEEYATWSPERQRKNLQMLNRQKPEARDQDNPERAEHS